MSHRSSRSACSSSRWRCGSAPTEEERRRSTSQFRRPRITLSRAAAAPRGSGSRAVPARRPVPTPSPRRRSGSPPDDRPARELPCNPVPADGDGRRHRRGVGRACRRTRHRLASAPETIAAADKRLVAPTRCVLRRASASDRRRGAARLRRRRGSSSGRQSPTAMPSRRGSAPPSSVPSPRKATPCRPEFMSVALTS